MSEPPGSQLERRVFAAISKLLKTGLLGLHPARATAHLHKKYYSSARKSEIEVDIAIEVTMLDSPSPVIVWIWECKDYKRPVGVEDIEEFDSKLQQIGANNTKGTVITTTGFHASAIQYAIERKIGLARLLNDDQIEMRWYAGGPTPQQRVKESLLLPDKSKTDNLLGGVLVDGSLFYRAAYEFHTDPLMEYTSRQLFRLLPKYSSDSCICCASPETTKNVLAKIIVTEPGDSWTDRNNIRQRLPFWQEFPLCATCFFLLRMVPSRYGLFKSQLLVSLHWPIRRYLMKRAAQCGRSVGEGGIPDYYESFLLYFSRCQAGERGCIGALAGKIGWVPYQRKESTY